MQNRSGHGCEANHATQTTNRWWAWFMPAAAILVACFVIACSTTVLGWSLYVTEHRVTRPATLVVAQRTAVTAATSASRGIDIAPLPTTDAPSHTASITRSAAVMEPVLQTPRALPSHDVITEAPALANRTPNVEVITSTLTALLTPGPALTRTTQSVVTSTTTAGPATTPVSVAQAQVPALAPAEVAPQPTLAVQPQGHIIVPAYNPGSGRWDLHIVAADGSGHSFLHESGGQPACSPDGRYVAFKYTHPSFLGLASLDLSNGQLVQLTHFAEDAWPSWSPDVGSLLAFSSQRQPDRRWRIYGLMTATQTDWELSVNNKPVYGHFPGWTTDNRMIYAGCVQAQCGVILADGDASNPRPLTLETDDHTLDASPDGEWVAFVRQRDAGWGIYIVDTYGSADRFPLLDSQGNEGTPEWSPDGSYLAFVSDLGGTTAVWAVPFDSVRPRHRAVPIKLFDLPDLPGDGWPWLTERIAWGP